MSFARPVVLLLLVLLVLWWRRRLTAKRPAGQYSDVSQLSGVGKRRRWLAELPAAFRTLALAAWIIAAAGPELGSSTSETTREGIAIVLAVDVSSSMLAEDFAPNNRLDVAKERSIAFVRGRKDDRIALVTFAGEALTRVPITVDYDVLDQAIKDIRIGELEDGTAIGTAIATSANRLRRAPGASKVIILLTDGVNNRGRVDPMTAAAAAAQLGIKIYTIGIGTQGEARLPIGRSPEGQLRYEMMPVEIDEDLLRDVSATTGGRYFRATDSEALRRIFEQIDQLEKAPVHVTVYTERDEWYRAPLLIGLGALAMELVIAATAVVRVP
jgi:Ca-activated chloride channel family protein